LGKKSKKRERDSVDKEHGKHLALGDRGSKCKETKYLLKKTKNDHPKSKKRLNKKVGGCKVPVTGGSPFA